MNIQKLLLLLSVTVVISCQSGDDDPYDEVLHGGQSTSQTTGGNTDNKDDEAPSTTVDENNKNANDTATSRYATRLEFPKLSGLRLVVHTTDDFGVNYSLEWNDSKKAQRWACLMMTAANMKSNWSRSRWPNGDPWAADPDIPAAYRTNQGNYSGSGFSRGHIVASADRLYSKYVNEQTFYYSNMQPMYYYFNSGAWEAMEFFVRNYVSTYHRSDTLYVCKGGTIDDDQTLMTTSTGLLVPKYFFMALLAKTSDSANGGYKAIGLWIEHTKESGLLSGETVGSDYFDIVSRYTLSIDELEEKTGIDFFCNLPDDIEDAVEASYDYSKWNYK